MRKNRGPLFPAGASRLSSFPIRLKHKAAHHFQTSLEEAAVSRPGREAGIKNDDGFERRRCGTEIMQAGSNAPAQDCDADRSAYPSLGGTSVMGPIHFPVPKLLQPLCWKCSNRDPESFSRGLAENWRKSIIPE